MRCIHEICFTINMHIHVRNTCTVSSFDTILYLPDMEGGGLSFMTTEVGDSLGVCFSPPVLSSWLSGYKIKQ